MTKVVIEFEQPEVPPVEASPDYFVGLDLGQASDFTALAVLERTVLPPDPSIPQPPRKKGTPPKRLYSFAVRHLQRFHLGTAYTAITSSIVDLFSRPPLTGATLAVDQTGVGRAVVDMLKAAKPKATIKPVTITAGHVAAKGKDGWLVPKKDLVGVMQTLLQTRRLKVAQGLDEAQTLAKELQNFQVKVTAAANEIYGAWREGQHDDLVLAVAIAAWIADRPPESSIRFV